MAPRKGQQSFEPDSNFAICQDRSILNSQDQGSQPRPGDNLCHKEDERLQHLMSTVEGIMQVNSPDKTTSLGQHMKNMSLDGGFPWDELEELRCVQDVMDGAIEDLTTTREELEDTKTEMAKKDAEILMLRQASDRLKSKFEEQKNQLAERERSFMVQQKEIEKRDSKLSEPKQTVNRLTTESNEKLASSQNEAELLSLRQRVADLIAELEVTGKATEKKDKELAERGHEWQKAKQEFEAQVQYQGETARLKISEHLKRCGEAEARVQDLQTRQQTLENQNRNMAQLQQTTTAAQVELERLKALELKHANEVQGLNRTVEFFKKNSERLSRETRDMKETIRLLNEELVERDGRLDIRLR
jgi:chromosome segregation ATPase